MTDPRLAATPLFSECSAEDIERLVGRLSRRELRPGEALMREGDDGTFFAVLVDGEVDIGRQTSHGTQHLAVAGPGSVLGELALLGRRPRSATVTATTPSVVLTGDVDDFVALLDLPGTEAPVRRMVSARLAQNVRSVPVTLRDGSTLLMRPLLATDRDELVAALQELSPQSLRRRFFIAKQPSRRAIDYLVELDYVNHFAWAVVDAARPMHGVGDARYVRDRAAPDQAEIALTVVDAYQGRGIGTLLVGALAAAAAGAGIKRFTASFLAENTPVRAVLAKVDASFSTEGHGETSAVADVDRALDLLPDDLRERLLEAARDIVTAAGLVLSCPCESET